MLNLFRGNTDQSCLLLIYPSLSVATFKPKMGLLVKRLYMHTRVIIDGCIVTRGSGPALRKDANDNGNT